MSFLKKKKKVKKHSSFFPLYFVFCFLFNNSFCFNLFYNPPNDRQRERFSMADGSLIVFIFLIFFYEVSLIVKCQPSMRF